MVTNNKDLNPPTEQDLNKKIWRYMSLPKFLSLLLEQSLFFCRINLLEDKYEGKSTENELMLKVYKSLYDHNKDMIRKVSDENLEDRKESIRKNISDWSNVVYVNCWNISEIESYSLWKAYSSDEFGIAIQSKIETLLEVLKPSTEINFFPAKVIYREELDQSYEGSALLQPYFRKRKEYKDENELRILYVKNIETGKSILENNVEGELIKIDLNKLIENIYISPYSSSWYLELVKEVISRFGFSFRVYQSSIFIRK